MTDIKEKIIKLNKYLQSKLTTSSIDWEREIAKILVEYDKRYTVASLSILMDKIKKVINPLLLSTTHQCYQEIENKIREYTIEHGEKFTSDYWWTRDVGPGEACQMTVSDVLQIIKSMEGK